MTVVKAAGTIWVCADCMFHAANGECGGCHGEWEHDREPWGLYADTADELFPTIGLLLEEHVCDNPMEEECECEQTTFSWSPCDACGSKLGGDRFAFTTWRNK